MSIDRISVNTTALPDALLPSIKAHCRVEHARDDDLLKTYTAAAIKTVESKCNVNLNPAEFVLGADDLPCSGATRFRGNLRPSWALPLNNVTAITISQSDDPASPDLSADYEVWSADYGGNAAAYLVATAGKPLPGTAVISLGVGVPEPTDLAPSFFSLIARLTASQYENREASSELWGETFNEELMGMWRPGA